MKRFGIWVVAYLWVKSYLLRLEILLKYVLFLLCGVMSCSGKRDRVGGLSLRAQKKKHFKETPVSELQEIDFSHVTVSIKDWDILFVCCDTVLKDSPDGSYKILVVCCMDLSCRFFKLKAMGTKAEDCFGLLEVMLLSIEGCFCIIGLMNICIFFYFSSIRILYEGDRQRKNGLIQS